MRKGAFQNVPPQPLPWCWEAHHPCVARPHRARVQCYWTRRSLEDPVHGSTYAKSGMQCWCTDVWHMSKVVYAFVKSAVSCLFTCQKWYNVRVQMYDFRIGYLHAGGSSGMHALVMSAITVGNYHYAKRIFSPCRAHRFPHTCVGFSGISEIIVRNCRISRKGKFFSVGYAPRYRPTC